MVLLCIVNGCSSFYIYLYPLVAQLVEQLPFKEMVVGSIPTERTILKTPI